MWRYLLDFPKRSNYYEHRLQVVLTTWYGQIKGVDGTESAVSSSTPSEPLPLQSREKTGPLQALCMA